MDFVEELDEVHTVHDPYVTVGTFHHGIEAHAARDALVNAGIPSELHMTWGPLLLNGATLVVPKSRAREAAAILADLTPPEPLDEVPDPEPEIPDDPEPLYPTGVRRFLSKTVLAALTALPINILIAERDLPFAEQVIAGMATVMFGAAGGGLALWDHNSRRRWLDWYARQVLPRPGEGAFALYLRPFAITNRLPVPKVDGPAVPMHPFGVEEEIDFEHLFREAYGESLRLVGIGKSGEAFGAGRVEIRERDWRKVIRSAIDRATEIVVVPGSRPGIRWELRRLRKQALHKTIFVMPPRSSDSAAARDVALMWAETVGSLAGEGLHLPPYDPKGLLFTLGRNGRVAARIEASVDPHDLRKRLTTLRRMRNERG